MDKLISKDGVELKVGMKVVHFLADDFSKAGEIQLIKASRHSTVGFDVFHYDEFGDISKNWPDLLIATPDGLLREQIAALKKSIPYWEKQIQEATVKIAAKESQLKSLEAMPA